MKFDTKYERMVDTGEDLDPTSKTEQAGYIPAQVQIERLMQAGKNLQNYRKDQYDFASDAPDDDSVHVPSRLPSFDMADASQLALDVEQRLAEQQAAIDAENAEKNSTATPSEEVTT